VQDLDGKNVKVGGKVVDSSIVHDQNGYHFTIVDLAADSRPSGELQRQMRDLRSQRRRSGHGPFAPATTAINAEQLQTKCRKLRGTGSGAQPSQGAVGAPA
jgi:hypothetical protein